MTSASDSQASVSMSVEVRGQSHMFSPFRWEIPIVKRQLVFACRNCFGFASGFTMQFFVALFFRLPFRTVSRIQMRLGLVIGVCILFGIAVGTDRCLQFSLWFGLTCYILPGFVVIS